MYAGIEDKAISTLRKKMKYKRGFGAKLKRVSARVGPMATRDFPPGSLKKFFNKGGFNNALKRTAARVTPIATKDFPPDSLKKLRRRDKSIRRFFAKRISRLRDKKRYTAAIVQNASQNIPLLKDRQTVGFEKTDKKIDALIAGNKTLRDQLIADNKLFQRNMRLKNDALIEQVRAMGKRENQFQTFSKPEIVRPSLPLIAPVETLSKNLKPLLPVIEPAEKTNFLVPIGVGLAALLMLKG